MKLIFCQACHDVVALRHEFRTCSCGASHGEYKDNLLAEIGGLAIPIGFANSSFLEALNDRPADGWGKTFEAFVIPHQCPTIWRFS